MNATSPSHDALLPHEDVDRAWDRAVPRDRLDAVRAAGRALHDEMMAWPVASAWRSVEMVRAPYPVKYGLRDAATVLTPFMHIVNRLIIVQWQAGDRTRTLLVSPTDVEQAAHTPYFARLAGSLGPFGDRLQGLIGPLRTDVPGALAEVGLRPEDVDYITYDHLHTQDVRRWLGDGTTPGFFPRAKLLVMRQEWLSCQGLLPPQQDWYRAEGTRGVPDDRVILLDGTTRLGPSVLLLATPGHTEGNHSIAVRTEEGVFVTSENGTGPDAYAPEHSAIPGVARYARERGMEVVLNGNTMERGLDQYISMILEKEVAGPSVRDPRFPNVLCSSEFDAFALFPGLRPTFRFGDIALGTVRRADGSTP